MAAVKGIVETALYVADLERAAGFYRRVFGLPQGRLEAFAISGS